jgi:tRNA(Arg) A34 adenosine deaminase TadA
MIADDILTKFSIYSLGKKMKNKHSTTRRALLSLAGVVALFPGFGSRRGYAAQTRSDNIDQPSRKNDQSFIDRAFEMRRQAIEIGDQGYGAVVVRDGAIVGQSPSHVIVHHDPTAHAEMEAIRDAAARLGSRDLSGCTLYSSSSACPMCEAAAYWGNIDRMVYGQAISDGGRPSLC